MSVLIETTEGDLVVDLLVDECPVSATNFLKLCKAKYFNLTTFSAVRHDRLCYAGSRAPTHGDSSAWGLTGTEPQTFYPEMQTPKIIASDSRRSFANTGTLAWVTTPSTSAVSVGPTRGGVLADSKFCISLSDSVGTGYDGDVAVFGRVVEGVDGALAKINDAIVDVHNKPLRPIVVLHTHILEDPFDEIRGLRLPESSPEPDEAQLKLIEEMSGSLDKEDNEEDEKRKEQREAASSALTLEIVGDLPFAEVLPEENVLFVCKLNPVTEDDDLSLIFSRFGPIRSCEVIRDTKTGDSLQYAFIEFENKKDCELAYAKMDGVVVDDRRIHVDFSQSVAKIAKRWRDKENMKRRGVSERRGGREDHEQDYKQRDERSSRDEKRYRDDERDGRRDRGGRDDRDRSRRDDRDRSRRDDRDHSRRDDRRDRDGRDRDGRDHDRRDRNGRDRHDRRDRDDRRDKREDRRERSDRRYRSRSPHRSRRHYH
ncbi:uncharacterized protein SAPINGB_P006136 [Magnusiomyces paraingens]|uniref:Peptidyl-prolyl cis-trans isomerase n=1 Tax=Magnusiomyces paraingens TaxID=2606893 RepID=A0A5E8C8L4_9ASCO|nr:uncharacterized protein SAPINGB_P006136 [Saprochaete ingens]VVT58298.1 unnamed protein product [Saprochaete ingens]